MTNCDGNKWLLVFWTEYFIIYRDQLNINLVRHKPFIVADVGYLKQLRVFDSCSNEADSDFCLSQYYYRFTDRT